MRYRTPVMLLLLYGLLTASLLFLVYAGAGLYGRVLEIQNNNNASRSALSFVQTQAAAQRGGVSLEDGPEGRAVVISDGGYDNWIYLSGGELKTVLLPEGARPGAGSGDAVCRLSVFAPEWEEEDLIKLVTDRGTAYIQCTGGVTDEE